MMDRDTRTLLEVRDLTTLIRSGQGSVAVVDGVSFSIERGEALGLVGESGSGKSMTCHSIMRIEPRPAATIAGGVVLLQGEDLLSKSAREMQQVRGQRIGMILQDPLNSLNPLMSIGKQIIEALRLSDRRSSAAALRRQAIDALQRVGITQAEERMHAYPFEFSGGMRQRVVAAIALVRRPDLIIADEPTTALDVTTQARFLDLLDKLRTDFNMGLLLVTHDLGIVAEVCDRVAVMYAGRIVETAGTSNLFSKARHPYTQALVKAVPVLHGERARRLYQIAGEPPETGVEMKGCRFAPRCEFASEQCRREYPPTVSYDNGDSVACWLHVPGENREAVTGS